MKDFSYITNASPAFIENMYQDFVRDPKTVDPEFRKFFEGFDFAIDNLKSQPNGNGAAVAAKKEAAVVPISEDEVDWMREIQVYRMILGYRNKGHTFWNSMPLEIRRFVKISFPPLPLPLNLGI